MSLLSPLFLSRQRGGNLTLLQCVTLEAGVALNWWLWAWLFEKAERLAKYFPEPFREVLTMGEPHSESTLPLLFLSPFCCLVFVPKSFSFPGSALGTWDCCCNSWSPGLGVHCWGLPGQSWQYSGCFGLPRIDLGSLCIHKFASQPLSSLSPCFFILLFWFLAIPGSSHGLLLALQLPYLAVPRGLYGVPVIKSRPAVCKANAAWSFQLPVFIFSLFTIYF